MCKEKSKIKDFDVSTKTDLSIVIVSYNVKNLLKECLESIYRTTKQIQFEVYIVDNHSSDGTIQMIQRDFPTVKLIRNKENIGFAKANNLAFRKSKGKYLLMLNPDTRILQNSFQKMINAFEKDTRIGVVGCKMLNPDGTLQPSCYDFPTLREIFGMYFIGSRIFGGLKKFDYNKMQEVDFVRGAFLTLNRKCLEEVGLLDENIFMFGEETDLCYRIKQSGWKVMYMPDTVIIHHKGKSTEQISDNMYLQRIRSLIYYFQKHYGKTRTLFLRVIILLGMGSRLVLRRILEIKNKRSGRRTISRSVQLDVLKLTLGLNK